MAATIKLAEIAPRIAKARDQQRAENMRGIKRCSCGFGWRIIGHEYDEGFGCIERLEQAQRMRDRVPEYRLAAPEQKSEAQA